jgi:mevalonate kinase
MLRARAPAKVLLCGEHAVVYGTPAIAVAVKRYATTEIQSQEASGIIFSLCDIRKTLRVTLLTLKKVRDRLVHTYHRFLEGQVSIRDVATTPGDLFQYAFLTLIEECEIEISKGLDIKVSSTIPIGCGMGSSAATVISFVQALLHHFHISKGIEWIERLICEVERLQHGKASGVDSFISLQGGCAVFQRQAAPRKLSLPQFPLWIVHTGRPESTTGECVSEVARKWKNSFIWKEFSLISETLEKAIEEHDVYKAKELFRENETLLEMIGVVPKKVQQFIKDIEALGGAAKISGAGAVRGDAGGIVLVLMDESITEICRKYDFEFFPFEAEPSGASVDYC